MSPEPPPPSWLLHLQSVVAAIVALVSGLGGFVYGGVKLHKWNATRKDNMAKVELTSLDKAFDQLNKTLTETQAELDRERAAHSQTRRELAEANQWRLDRLQREADRLEDFRDQMLQKAEHLRAERTSSAPSSTSKSAKTPSSIPSLPSPPKTQS